MGIQRISVCPGESHFDVILPLIKKFPTQAPTHHHPPTTTHTPPLPPSPAKAVNPAHPRRLFLTRPAPGLTPPQPAPVTASAAIKGPRPPIPGPLPPPFPAGDPSVRARPPARPPTRPGPAVKKAPARLPGVRRSPAPPPGVVRWHVPRESLRRRLPRNMLRCDAPRGGSGRRGGEPAAAAGGADAGAYFPGHAPGRCPPRLGIQKSPGSQLGFQERVRRALRTPARPPPPGPRGRRGRARCWMGLGEGLEHAL